jgi:hypothetical protein
MAYVEYPKPKVPNGYQALPVGATCVKLTVPTSSRYAVGRVATNDIRYRDDGPSAVNTTTGGITIKVDEKIELTSPEQLAGFRAISTGATGMFEVSYYKV